MTFLMGIAMLLIAVVGFIILFKSIDWFDKLIK
jgi:inner membrane protein involved in colicin E2 resistance